VCRSKHVEQLRNNGIINSTTRSHLVGYFYTIYMSFLYETRSHITVLKTVSTRRLPSVFFFSVKCPY